MTMKLLGLPGIKPVTAQWMSQLLNAVDLNQTEAVVQHYQSWTHPGSQLNFDGEASIAAKSDPDIVISKSIGTRVLLHAFSNGLIPAKPFVLIGIPIKGYSESEISILNKLCTIESTLIIQQINDPVGSYELLVTKIPETSYCKLVNVPGNDHFYGDIEELKFIIESWHHDLCYG